ncbi:hypothetical protein BsWGS_27266 [Bradybaena similaris]
METTVHCPPIKTARLNPVRQQLNNTCIAVSDTGQVTLEVKSRVSKACDNHPCDKTKQLIRISSDGMQIDVFNIAETATSIDGCPASSQPNQVYSYPDMPEKLWKKYHHAYKFVEVMKSVTPKVTLLTDRARCKLMENAPNAHFQASFHHGVTLLFSRMKVTLTEHDGSSLTFHEDLASSHVSADTLALLEYSLQCRDQCLKIEESVRSLQLKNPHQDLFPVSIGTNNQLYLSSLNQLKVLSTKPDSGIGGIHHLSEMRAGILNQSRNQQSQSNVNAGTNTCKETTGSELSQKQIHKNINVFQYDMDACPHPQNNLNSPMDESFSDRNLPLSWESSDFRNSPQSLVLQSGSSTKEASDWLLRNAASFQDFNCSINSCPNSISDSVLAAPLRSNNKAASLQSDNSSRMHIDRSHDAVKQIAPTTFIDCGDQLPDWQNMSRHVINAGLINKFELELKIPENLHDSPLVSENSCDERICGNEQLAFSPSAETHLCDNTHCQTSQITNITNMPDLYRTQFQNSYVTPQKSQVTRDYYRCPYSDDVMRCRYKTPVMYDSQVDERQLRNVKRNLFSDQTSEDLKSPPLQSPTSNILMQGMINISDGNSKTDLVYQNTELQTLMQSRLHERIPLQTGMSTEDVLPIMTSQLTPGKVSHVTKSIMRYPQCSVTPTDNHTESPELPLHSGSSSVQNSMHSTDLLLSFSEDTNSKENSNAVNTHSAAFTKPFTQLQSGSPFPENSTSPRKSTPLRKVACLSPVKTGSCSIQRIPDTESTRNMSDDFLPFKYQASPVMSNRSSPGDSSVSSITNYQSTQSSENLTNHAPDIGTLNIPAIKSLPGIQLCQNFPSILPSSNNWNSLDLPFSRHIRHSLDVSSDDRSSSPPSSTSDVISQVFVPYIGWASLYSTGTVWILYNDGTQLGVKSTEATVIYIGQDGSRARYNNTDVLPEIVKLKLEKLPKVIDLIKKSQETGFSGVQLCQS